jgi:GDP-mannose 6-dehydrogenase
MIAVFGLGHVGIVTAICLANKGFDVIGIDKSEEKIQALDENELYIYEKDLADLFKANRSRLTFSTDFNAAKNASEILVCVGTPSLAGGDVDYSHITAVCQELQSLQEINNNIKNIFIRSTVQPQTTRSKLSKFVSDKINLLFYPEFLREGTAVSDFATPEQTIIGIKNQSIKDNLKSDLLSIFDSIDYVTYETAEMIKYTNNSFHALKVSFINEIATVAEKYDVNLDELHHIFTSEKKLNISSAYLKPGFSFGGTCLNKDTKGFLQMAKQKGITTPLIQNILPSNNEHLLRYIAKIEEINPKKVLFCGVAFKSGTNDIRNSPIVDLINLFYLRPSYIKKTVHIYEDKKIVKSIKQNERLNSFKILSDYSDLDKDYDLIVFGTHIDEALTEHHTTNKKSLHLGFIL